MTEFNDHQYVFVYGTLKEGFANHNHFLGQSEFVADACTQERYRFLSLGAFPAVHLPNNEDMPCFHVHGEVYKASPRTMVMLDRLEGNGTLYQRHLRPVEVVLDGTVRVLHAWIYEILDHTCDDYCKPNEFLDLGHNTRSWYGRCYG